jgi:hypothetical protein
MRTILTIFVLCLLSAPALAQQPPSEAQLYAAQDDVRVKLYQYSYRKSIRMESLDDSGAVTGWREGVWSLYLRLHRSPEVRRLSLKGPGLKRVAFPSGAALSGAVQGLPAFFSDRCGLRLVGRDGGLWKFRTWAGATAWENAPCFDGLVWTTDAGVAVRAEGRRAPAYQFYDGVEHRAVRSAYTMDSRGFPLWIEGEDILAFSTAFERDKNGRPAPLRARVRQLVIFSRYETMHTAEPVVIEEGEPGDVGP